MHRVVVHTSTKLYTRNSLHTLPPLPIPKIPLLAVVPKQCSLSRRITKDLYFFPGWVATLCHALPISLVQHVKTTVLARCLGYFHDVLLCKEYHSQGTLSTHTFTLLSMRTVCAMQPDNRRLSSSKSFIKYPRIPGNQFRLVGAVDDPARIHIVTL